MFNLKPLNNKEAKKIVELVKKEFDIKDLKLDYIFFKKKDGKIFLVSDDLRSFDFSKIRVNSIGLYFGKLENEEMRLSIDGSQLIGKKAKNIVELDEEEAKEWLRGIDLDKKTDKKGFVIVKSKDDFLGCGKFKEDKILNYIPKSRRLRI